MPLPDVAFLLVAGMVAGVIGTAGGITSVVSYPALLAVGLPAYEANVANLLDQRRGPGRRIGRGSRVGPLLARRLPAGILRWAVAILGFALAVILFADTA